MPGRVLDTDASVCRPMKCLRSASVLGLSLSYFLPPFEFCPDLWHQQTRVNGLSYMALFARSGV